jgi:outer membrane protein insertion porin family
MRKKWLPIPFIIQPVNYRFAKEISLSPAIAYVEGLANYEDYVLLSISGLTVGQTVTIPGLKRLLMLSQRYWKHGLFSNVSISVEKQYKDKVWLLISLAQHPRISPTSVIHGVKKGETN